MFEYVAVLFITVHAPDGQEVVLNISEISSIRKPREGADDHFAEGTKCLLTMSNGKFTVTTETCLEIVHKIAIANKEEQP
jgi:uncharacterized protein YlzI (FlbEa/FlbD family)